MFETNGELFALDTGLLSDVGCVRTNNEDAGRILLDPASRQSSERVLALVADGMGGHRAGEVASALAAETLEAAFPGMRSDPGDRLKQAVVDANQRIFTESAKSAERHGMGTTCTALLLQDGQAYAAHVGDSRIYLLRDGELYLATEDHSQVMEMVKAGFLTRGEARHHPGKNIITRALGRGAEIEVDTWPQPLALQSGDAFLLCSDGLCDAVEDDEIYAIVSVRSAAEACEELVRLARQRHAADNVTVAIVRLHSLATEDGEVEPLLDGTR